MTESKNTENLNPIEQALVNLDSFPWSAAYRTVIGFLILPALRAWNRDSSAWALTAFLMGTLVMLRVVPAIVRQVIPFPRTVRVIWAERRQLAKRYDSYQWQKLLWIGMGVGLSMVFFGRVMGSGMVVAAACISFGALGAIRWRDAQANRGRRETA